MGFLKQAIVDHLEVCLEHPCQDGLRAGWSRPMCLASAGAEARRLSLKTSSSSFSWLTLHHDFLCFSQLWVGNDVWEESSQGASSPPASFPVPAHLLLSFCLPVSWSCSHAICLSRILSGVGGVRLSPLIVWAAAAPCKQASRLCVGEEAASTQM